MTKKQAVEIISRCAKQYKKYLENYQVAFVYRDSNNHSDYTEVQFRAHNFLHFTGVIPRDGTEKVTGTTSACLGLIQKNDIFYPNSVLYEDIRIKA